MGTVQHTSCARVMGPRSARHDHIFRFDAVATLIYEGLAAPSSSTEPCSPSSKAAATGLVAVLCWALKSAMGRLDAGR